MTAIERLEELDARRVRAAERVAELEAEQRQVRAAVGEAAAVLAEPERRGDATPAQRICGHARSY